MSSYCVIPNLLLYGAAAILSVLEYWSTRPVVRTWAYRLFLCGVAVHSAYLVSFFFWVGFPFVPARGIVMGLLTWTCAVVYAVLARDTRWRYLSGCFLPLIFLLFLQSVARGPEYAIVHRMLPSAWAVSLHLGVATIAVALCLVSGVIGLILLQSARQIKSRRPGRLWLVLPSLPTLERTLATLLMAGFLALTLTLATGVILTAWSPDLQSAPWLHKLTSLVAWGIYGVVLQTRWFSGGMGRKGVILSCLGCAVVLFSFLEVHTR